MARKLYEVTYTYVAYVLADDADEALDLGKEAMSLQDPDEDTSSEVVPGTSPKGAWDDKCLVFHDGPGDINLKDVWPKPKPKTLPPPACNCRTNVWHGVHLPDCPRGKHTGNRYATNADVPDDVWPTKES